ncbi:efflux RND transporter periplasmic adaptor subunit [uncultured Tateyamaria sp.]|nr:efflux RND transporter periplasmic adaptor subunit [uncultured Tateyamaria sp.]
MNILRQIGYTGVLLAAATVAVARYYPDSHVMFRSLGIPDTVLGLASPEQDTAQIPADGRRGPPRGGARATLVTTAPVSTGVINATVQAIGSSEALRSVSVVPLDDGVLTEVAVRSGDIVTAGAVLARLNSDTEEIVRDRAQVTLNNAQKTYARYEALMKSNAASQSELDSLLSDRDDAALALREAEVALEQRTVFAPFDGHVGIVPIEVGDHVSTQTEIAMVDDRSKVVVDFWVPERFSSTVAIGQPVKVTSLALSGLTFDGTVSAIGSRVETDSRTLQVRAQVDNPDDMLRPGMSFSISMAFAGATYPAVDPLAVQWDADGSYVWVVADGGVAARTPVRIVQRNAASILIDADVDTDTQVITEGILNVRDGATVTVQGASAAAAGVAAIAGTDPANEG